MLAIKVNSSINWDLSIYFAKAKFDISFGFDIGFAFDMI